MTRTRRETFPASILLLAAAAVVLAFPTASMAAEPLELPDGSKLDLTHKCPFCRMPIGGKDAQGVTVTYKDGRMVTFAGVAAAVFKDGRVVGFEGARCLFIYNSVPQKYDADVRDIKYQFVTDFVSKKFIDLAKAFLVLGSNVKGPMGYELIAFSTKEEAAKFASENDGKWIVQLHEVLRIKEEEPGKPGSADTGETRAVGDEKPTVQEPEASQPQKSLTDKARKRSDPQRVEEFDPYESSARSLGHHGRGHHMMQ